MKKQFLNLGKALNKAEQKQITGGTYPYFCRSGCDNCPDACVTIFNSSCPGNYYETCILI